MDKGSSNQSSSQKITALDQINQGNLLSDDVLEFCFSAESESELNERKAYCVDIGAKHRLKGKYLEYWRNWKEELERQGKLKHDTNRTQLPGVPKDKQMACGTWNVNARGVYRYETRRDDTVKVKACGTPVVIERYIENVKTRRAKAVIAFWTDGKKRKMTVDASTLADSRKIIELSNYRLDVTSKTAGNLIDYFEILKEKNKIPTSISTSQMGWYRAKKGNLSFLPYEEEGMLLDSKDDFAEIYHAIRRQGDYSKWKELVYSVCAMGRIEPRIMIAASVASVLVSIVGALPFVVDLYGRTEGGKSVCLMLATSIWADPDLEGPYYGDFKATYAAMEVRENLLNHLPLMLDDSAKIKSKYGAEKIRNWVYAITNGHSKQRSNVALTARPQMSWCNVTITTGEQSLAQPTAQGGELNRIFEVEAGASNIFNDRGFMSGHYVAEIVKENFGFAGHDIVKFIKLIGADKLKQSYRTRYDRMVDAGVMEKQASSAAVLLLADKIFATAVMDEMVDELTEDQIRPFLKDEAVVDENIRMYAIIIDTVNANISKFYDDHIEPEPDDKQINLDHGKPVKPEIWGRIDRSRASDKVYFNQTILSKIVSDHGGNIDQFLSWAKRSGVLVDCVKKKFVSRKRMLPKWLLKLQGQSGRQEYCYAIDISSAKQNAILRYDDNRTAEQRPNDPVGGDIANNVTPLASAQSSAQQSIDTALTLPDFDTVV